MAISNHERVGKALELLRDGLRPFVEQEMKGVHGDGWLEAAQDILRGDRPPSKGKGKPKVNWDTHALLAVMWNQWNNVLRNTLGHAERSIVSELRDARNRWAHQNAFNTDDTYRALDSMHRLLTAISAKEADEIDRQKQEILRIRYSEQTRQQTRKASIAAVAGQPYASLEPWREIVTPHPDVTSGNYQQAEFAADLAKVHRGEASSEYGDPAEFFSRTFLTDGLRDLLAQALKRLSGNGGEPAIELQTNFGGGKTHAMLALYHLVSGISQSELTGIEPVLEAAGVGKIPKAKRVVLVGTALSPGQAQTKPDGTVINTLWGELAWQLGRKEGYALVQPSDENGTNPGDALIELFKRFSPCMILIDEWVAYARQLYKKHDLPAGDFEAHFSFAQALTEKASEVPQTIVVATLLELTRFGGHLMIWG